MRLTEDHEPSRALVLAYYVSSVYGYWHHYQGVHLFSFYHKAQLKESLKLFLLFEIGLCLAGLLMASENTAMQSYFCGSF